ncbi:3-keto-5-aminohexanoate cleavage protein [Frankia sp. CNm7]|uniref:3-keto-5-aminohexanoate cleavage protein n=1 Tax=Frankia nepalensis TaxID=1836974 RepID=A0A937RNL1_9ACTN|nr:3-keto-5-aminohexanoate cleavage protein [Frankia nepalensis]MBL7502066.1 3-keto-5-aminohexanoate cleavage protein [Frankia nepalensis]MBL7511800.1 3-keto-5-aminohexanoate cleavage protein [Frankia nepalensis]MBL7524653.1 3-keto-5-aminohexanoate cleavage protein [Frankia nepalensis]MBL7630564.1 3-keto-5-aminohexanoate cleavage protein [Frankia nepalensis]
MIIEAAINGSVGKAQNPNVPISPEEIAADAIACLDAGAAIIHNHVDTFGPDAVAAERYLRGWRPVLAARPEALIYPTVNPGPGGEIGYDHQVPLAESGLLRIAIVDPGSVNLGGRGPDGIPTGGFVYRNSYDAIAHAFGICREHALGPSIAIYEPGWLRTTLAWWDAGRLPQGAMIKLYFSTERGLIGAPFGLPPTAAALDAYLEILGDRPLPWAVSVVGGDVVAADVARLALERGGHLHLGVEFYGGQRQPTNVELVTEAVALCKAVGRPVASSPEAAELLDLPRR